MSRNVMGLRDEESGEVSIHQAASIGNYSTLCGLSTDDDLFTIVSTKPNARINCQTCHQVWAEARGLQASDFTQGATP